MSESASFLEYQNYVNKTNTANSGKAKAYLAVMSRIGKVLKRHPKFAYLPNDLTSIKNLELLYQIYEFVKEEQKKSDGGIFNGSELTKGYWSGRYSFCSAAIRNFMQYRMETYDGPLNAKDIKTNLDNKEQSVAQQEHCKLDDFIEKFKNDAQAAGLKYDINLVKRFVCALLAKPFVVLTGLSGSGKTKLAQAFAEWIAVDGTSCIVPVGADWANSEKMLGYPNGLDPANYVLPDSGVLKLMIDANNNPNVPFFLILDEMNLSHVERYFADFLSAMESKGSIKLYDGNPRTATDGTPIPQSIKFPENLFVIGTMNVDETTHAFSPKVLDRAQVIEFRVTSEEMRDYLKEPAIPDIEKLVGKGAAFANAFRELHDKKQYDELPQLNDDNKEKIAEALNNFFPELAELGAEFAYRTAGEALRFCAFACSAGMSVEESIDAAIMQKLLPKLHGSRRRLALPLEAFWGFCRKEENTETLSDTFKKDITVNIKDVAKYPISAEKIRRLYKAAETNGFASYAEA